MDYEKKYKEALSRAKGMWEQGMMPERIEYIIMTTNVVLGSIFSKKELIKVLTYNNKQLWKKELVQKLENF